MNRLEKIELAIEKGITCNPETGDVFGVRGKKIKSKTKSGYFVIGFSHDNKNYRIRAHQFIWYSAYGEVVDRIDHINRNKTDNRLENLRYISQSENVANNEAIGYYWSKSHSKYRARITINYKTIHLGFFNTEKEAREAYLIAKRKYFPNL